MSQEPVSIKGTRHGLVIRLTEDLDFAVIKNDLRRKMEASHGFFRGARYSIGREAGLSARQREELDELCREFGLVPGSALPVGPRASQPPGEPAFLARGSLRSGQRLVHPGHVVLVGDVHPGAIVTAGHNVVVLGTCRGTVAAGTSGDDGATVFSLRLSPLRLSIAGQAAEDRILRRTPAGPAVARLDEGRISLTPWRRPK